MIDRVGLEHAGEYKCTVRTVDRTRQWTEHMRVLVMFPPRIDTFREDADIVNFLVPEGEDFRMPCNVRGFPDAQVQWLYEGRILPIKEGRVREVFQKIRRDANTPQMFVSGSTLEVLGFNHRDNGIYRCHSVNQAGNATRAVYAVVQEKPIIVATQTVRALVGTNITMATFRVLGAPPIQLSAEHRHLRESDTAPPRHQITFAATGRHTFASRQEKVDVLNLRLDISDIRLTDAGRYRFVIHNRGGHALLSVKLLVYPFRSKRGTR